MKYLLSFIAFSFISTLAFAQQGLVYSNWLFVQSDKALQFRIAVAEQTGNVARLQLQFRVNDEDEVYCTSDLCDGMLLSLKNQNVGDDESTQYSFIFEKSFKGINNIYTWPTLLTTELKTWPDGSKRFFSQAKGIVYTLADSDEEKSASVPYCCVDVRLAGQPDEHRCDRHGFDASEAVVVR